MDGEDGVEHGQKVHPHHRSYLRLSLCYVMIVALLKDLWMRRPHWTPRVITAFDL